MSVYDNVRHRIGVLSTELEGAPKDAVLASMHFMDDLERQIKELEYDLGQTKIQLDHKTVLLASCEKALQRRDE